MHAYTVTRYGANCEHGHDDDVAGVYDGHDDGADDAISQARPWDQCTVSPTVA